MMTFSRYGALVPVAAMIVLVVVLVVARAAVVPVGVGAGAATAGTAAEQGGGDLAGQGRVLYGLPRSISSLQGQGPR